ncbi:MAG: hypothetical protein WDZ51_06735 [Pirellulaceae bacterium]
MKLGFDRQRARPIGTPLQLHWAIFDAARRCGDFDFIQNNPDYHLMVQYIDTGSYHWLDFEFNRESQIDLFATGVEAAAKFLKTFDWDRYRAVRRDMNRAWELQGGGHDPPESSP